MHKHRAKTEDIRGYSGAVAYDVGGPYRQNRAAHGGICVTRTCACGAEQKVNSNGNHVERGRWK